MSRSASAESADSSALVGNPNAAEHEHDEVDHALVRGRIAAPPSLTARELISIIDAGVDNVAGVRVYAPELSEAAGDAERARAERESIRLLEMGGPEAVN